jgi:hypothetical protein
MRGSTPSAVRLTAVVLAVGTCSALVPAAGAATKIFYAGSTAGLASASVFTVGGSTVPLDSANPGSQYSGTAVAVDSTTGRLYWAGQTNPSNPVVSSADNRGFVRAVSASDGTSVGMTAWGTSTTGNVVDLTIDPLTQTAYWSGTEGASNFLQSGTIGGASLPVGTVASSPASSLNLALNPANGRLITGQSVATNGSNVTLQQYTVSTMASPTSYSNISANQRGITSIVTNLTGSRGYWTYCNAKINVFGVGCMDSSGGTGVAGDVYEKSGLAGNPASNLAMAEFGLTALAVDGSGCLIYANTNGDIKRSSSIASCTQTTLLLGAGHPIASLWIVESPSTTGNPTVSGSGVTNSPLTCNDATWAADVPGARLSRMPGSRTYTWQRDGVTVASASTSTHTPTTAGSYTCAITGTNVAGSGASGTSAALAVTAPAIPVAAPSSGSATSVPSAPSTPTAARSGTGAITVKWAAPASDGGSAVTGYTVTASPGGRTCTSATTSCKVTSLTNGTKYTFTVVATNAVGTSSASGSSASAYPYASLKVAWKMSGKKATATWKPVSGAKSYTVTGGLKGKTAKSGKCTKTKTKVTCTVTLAKGTNTLTAAARNAKKANIAMATTTKKVK